MMRNIITYDQDPRLLQFACEVLEVRFEPSKVRTIAYLQVDGDTVVRILAVVVYSNFLASSVELSIASEPGLWASRRFIRAVYEHAFNHLKRERLTMVVAHDNDASIVMHNRLGHKYDMTLDDWFGQDKPALIFGLTKRAYLSGKWASTKRTKEEATHELQQLEG